MDAVVVHVHTGLTPDFADKLIDEVREGCAVVTPIDDLVVDETLSLTYRCNHTDGGTSRTWHLEGHVFRHPGPGWDQPLMEGGLVQVYDVLPPLHHLRNILCRFRLLSSDILQLVLFSAVRVLGLHVADLVLLVEGS